MAPLTATHQERAHLSLKLRFCRGRHRRSDCLSPPYSAAAEEKSDQPLPATAKAGGRGLRGERECEMHGDSTGTVQDRPSLLKTDLTQL